MNREREFICEYCGHSITKYEEGDYIYSTTCSHLYHYNCLYSMINSPMEKVNNKGVTKCKRCNAIIGPHDYQKIEPHIRNVEPGMNDPHVSPVFSEQQLRTALVSCMAEITSLRNKNMELHMELHTLRQQQTSSLLSALVPPPIQPPPPPAPLQQQPTSLFGEHPLAARSMISQSAFYPNAKPTMSSYQPPVTPLPASTPPTPMPVQPPPGGAFVQMPVHHTLHFNNQQNNNDARRIIEQQRAVTLTTPQMYPPPPTSGIKRPSPTGEPSQDQPQLAHKYLCVIPGSRGANGEAAKPRTRGSLQNPTRPGRQPPPPQKRGTPKEKGSNMRRYRLRFLSDPEELRPFYPLNSFPYDFMAGGFEIDEDRHYIVFFAHNILLIGDGHVTSMVQTLAIGKPYRRKLHPSLYHRDLTIRALVHHIQTYIRFPPRVMLSIGNFDIHQETKYSDFNESMKQLIAAFKRLGVREIIFVPLLPNTRQRVAFSAINQILNYNWSNALQGDITHIGEIFHDLHQIPPITDEHGPYYTYEIYTDILNRIARQFVPPIPRDSPANNDEEDEDSQDVPENIHQEVENIAIQNDQQPPAVPEQSLLMTH